MSVTLKVDESSQNSFPSLLSFPSGISKDFTAIEIKVFQKGEGNKRKNILLSDINGSKFRGSDFGENATRKNSCTYAIAEYDEGTNKMILRQASHAFVMRIHQDEALIGHITEMDYMQRRESLTEAFGSRKKKRAMHATQSNTILSENITGAAALENSLTTTSIQVIKEENSPIKLVDAAQEAMDLNRQEILPTFNRHATKLPDAYPIESIITENISFHMKNNYNLISNEFTKDNETGKQSYELWLQYIIEMNLPKTILYLFTYPDMNQIESSSKKYLNFNRNNISQ